MSRWKRKGLALLLLASMMVVSSGCGAGEEQETASVASNTEAVEGTEDFAEATRALKDKDTLYANDDEDSVVTMYLTLTTGNASDNTDHTWTEVNSYSAYDYDEMGVERYAVNGLLQVGDENGPLEGELGYDQTVPNATVTI